MQGHIGNRCALPQPAAHIFGKLWPGVGGVQEDQVLDACIAGCFLGWDQVVRAPGKEFRHGQPANILGALFDHQAVDAQKIGGRKAQLGEDQVDAVHPKGGFVAQPGQIGLFQAGTVADDEAALAAMFILEIRQPADALAPPGMEGGSRPERQALECIAGVAGCSPDWLWQVTLERLFQGSILVLLIHSIERNRYSVLRRAVAPPSTIRACPVINEDWVSSARK